ncbi:MAG: prolyl oligopeptidase family serine peptidase [Armatimonadota bacterium]
MRSRIRTLIFAACLGGAAAVSAGEAAKGWQADPKLLAELAQKGTAWIFRESDVPKYTLPDPLAVVPGTPVRSRVEWERVARPATLALFRDLVYGRSPEEQPRVRFREVRTDPAVMGGRATLRQVEITAEIGEASFTFPASVLVPNRRSGPAPAFLLINNRPEASADPTRRERTGFWPAEEILARGYAAAVFRTNDVDPDRDGAAAREGGVRGVWPAGSGVPGRNAWGTLAAWAWGASRVLDYLQQLPEVDSRRVAVVGHSRGGKTALWAGAQDRRFALVVSNDSGCGGAALSRRRFGETVERINTGFPYWFAPAFRQFNGREDELPVDQHQLLALMAPRPVYVASADADFWADQRGEFLSLAHAAPVYALYGQPALGANQMPPLDTPVRRGRMGYHIRRGGHDLTAYDWERFMDFADSQWKVDRAP